MFFGHQDNVWKTLVGLSALSVSLGCVLLVFESLFVGITFGYPSGPEVCRIGAGLWAGSFGATCAALVLIVLCRRKDEFSKFHTFWFCAGMCAIPILADCALIVLESMCFLTTDTESPLPVFLLSAATVHLICSISEMALLYVFWKSSLIAEKEKEKKKSPLDQRRMIIIPNILQSHPSFVSIELN